MTRLPLVALVGRPNVGKSTLFNRIIGGRKAVVNDAPGTTRDRQQDDSDWQGLRFTLVDTGGIEALNRVNTGAIEALAEDSKDFVKEIRAQAEIAIQDADVLMLVVDISTGITAADEEVVRILRTSNKPILVAANKADNRHMNEEKYEFYNLGIGDVYPISAMHGAGVGDLLDAVIENLPFKVEVNFDEEEDDGLVKIAIVGRPNVGKSSLLNRILGEERVIVSPVAGTTRDSIDIEIIYHGEPVTLIDTAGMRRRGKIDPGVEKYSVLRSLRAIKRADVALLLIDALEGITAQDAHVAGYIREEFKSVLLLVNKWDAVAKDTYTVQAYTETVRDALKFLPYVPVMFISAKTGQRVSKILPEAFNIYEERYVRIPTAEVNQIVRDAVSRQPPHARAGRRLKIRYASQVATAPPKFLFHVNDEKLVHFSYERYLENRIREAYPFVGTPVLMEFRRSSDDRHKRRH